MQDKRIVVASDHGGYALKKELISLLKETGYEVTDLGSNEGEKADYPDKAGALANFIKEGKALKGLLICGTGIGMSISVNRYPFIRGALVHDAYTARMAREHNDANVLILGGRTTGIEVAKECLTLFLETKFLGGHHTKRVEKLSKMC